MSRSIRKIRTANNRGISFVVGVVIVGIGVVNVSSGSGSIGSVSIGSGIVVIVDNIIRLISGRRRLREERASNDRYAVSAPTSLRWVRGVLPGDEGTKWFAEVNSCLAETADPGERRRYVRSYRRRTPQLIWTSWSEHLNSSGRRELS